MARFEIKRRGALLGTEVTNADLSRECSAQEIRELHELWMKHPLLVFPRQRITDAQQIAFARRFGELEIHPAREHRSSTHPEIYRVSNVDEAGNILGGGTGYAFATLPPATREVIKLTSGFNDIPIAHAVSAIVSMQPTWSQAQP